MIDSLAWWIATHIPSRIGNDGLTRWERRHLARRYMMGPGRMPKSTPERTARLNALAEHGPLRATSVRTGPAIGLCRVCGGEGYDDDGQLCHRCHGSGDNPAAAAPLGDPEESA